MDARRGTERKNSLEYFLQKITGSFILCPRPQDSYYCNFKKGRVSKVRKGQMIDILFTAANIGGVKIANRLVMAAMTTNFADPEGHVTEKMIAYYLARARGGTGLIVVEPASVELRGKRLSRNLAIYKDDFIPGLTRLAEQIKKAGSRVFLQINHGGRECSRSITGEQPVAPSRVASSYSGIKSQGEEPKTLTSQEIEQWEDAFAAAACRAERAGFDGVEIHGAHGYLVSQFCSPLTNLRTDSYGLDVRGRALFFRNIIERCKQKLGPGFPVVARINGVDYVEGGIDVDEALGIAKLLEEAGADAIHVSVGTHASRPYLMIPGMHVLRGCNLELTKRFKQSLGIPIICVGRINHPKVAAEAIAGGAADFVAMGRALIADPELPQKIREKREDLRLCIACNEGCLGRLHRGMDMSCSVNPEVGYEIDSASRMARPPQQREIWVIGGGPAGLEAARVAALRGCKVTLWEKGCDIGGQLNLAVIPPDRQEIGNIISYYKSALPRLGVTIKIEKEVTGSLVRSHCPAAGVLATGAIPAVPSIPGVNQNHVFNAWEILSGRKEAGKKCVVIGAGPVGMETAEFLAVKRHSIILLDILPWSEVLRAYPRAEVVYHEMKREELGIEFHGPVQIVNIAESSITYKEGGWKKSIMEVDTVVLATGATPCNDLIAGLSGTGLKIISVGDCSRIGKIIDAIHSGYEAALAL